MLCVLFWVSPKADLDITTQEQVVYFEGIPENISKKVRTKRNDQLRAMYVYGWMDG